MKVRDARPVIAETMPNGDVYYAAMLTAAPDEEKTDAVRKVAVYWDASYSRGNSDLAVEKKLLMQVLKTLRPNAVELILLRAEPEETETFDGTDKGIQKLVERLDKVVYDGASKLSDLPVTGAELGLLFSDGFETLPVDGQPTTCKLHSISSAGLRDAEMLQRIAFRSGGQYVNLRVMSLAQAQQALLGKSVIFQSSTARDAWPRTPRPVGSGLVLAGKTDGDKAITVTMGSRKQSIAIPDPYRSYDGFLKSVYGLTKLRELNLSNADDKDAITQTAQAHHLPSRYTSLIVLENLSDYMNFRIRPPNHLSRMQKKYDRWLEEKQEFHTDTADRQAGRNRDAIASALKNAIRRMATRDCRFVQKRNATVPVSGSLPVEVSKLGDSFTEVSIDVRAINKRRPCELMAILADAAEKKNMTLEFLFLQKPEEQPESIDWETPEQFLVTMTNACVRDPFGYLELDFGGAGSLSIPKILERLNAVEDIQISTLDGVFIISSADSASPSKLLTLGDIASPKDLILNLAGYPLPYVDEAIGAAMAKHGGSVSWGVSMKKTNSRMDPTVWLRLGPSKPTRATAFFASLPERSQGFLVRTPF